MTFEEIPLRMMKLSVTRKWLCEQCDYTPSTLASILAPKGTNKTEKALRRIWEALDREEERQGQAAAKPPYELQQLVLRPDDAHFELWNEVSRKAGMNIREWAVAALTRNAKNHTPPASVPNSVPFAPAEKPHHTARSPSRREIARSHHSRA